MKHRECVLMCTYICTELHWVCPFHVKQHSFTQIISYFLTLNKLNWITGYMGLHLGLIIQPSFKIRLNVHPVAVNYLILAYKCFNWLSEYKKNPTWIKKLSQTLDDFWHLSRGKLYNEKQRKQCMMDNFIGVRSKHFTD